jgi:hypothetical protein
MVGKRDTHIWWENVKDGDHLEDLEVDGRIILKWTLKTRCEGTDWIHLDQDKDQ